MAQVTTWKFKKKEKSGELSQSEKANCKPIRFAIFLFDLFCYSIHSWTISFVKIREKWILNFISVEIHDREFFYKVPFLDQTKNLVCFTKNFNLQKNLIPRKFNSPKMSVSPKISIPLKCQFPENVTLRKCMLGYTESKMSHYLNESILQN